MFALVKKTEESLVGELIVTDNSVRQEAILDRIRPSKFPNLPELQDLLPASTTLVRSRQKDSTVGATEVAAN